MDTNNYENITQFLSDNTSAMSYFNSLSAEMQQKILDRGTGVTTFSQLMDFQKKVENNEINFNTKG